ncbi:MULTISPECIES: hypothetical protein [Vibrio]|uniref:hypothetical protein n=1 Tax=Vibrio TaxID=662 RepID=UPI00215F91B2|nr:MULTISPECIES: hypothetical protein [Vibrio]MCS0150596.1 hypothetical protein [Vibrio alginolyticus]MDW1592462.1 hypothetical protein [Vibrio sp. Vb2944]MDW1609968.1 hypothetical protein [Vibrio sp. Vb2908]MDW1725869.1 hypothetical protein [Vibrio sp. Vb2909]
MAQGIISDNWSLQDISSLFVYGMEKSFADEIVISNGEHSYKEVSYASIQTEALFDFLTDLVLRDEILVEAKFEHAWMQTSSPILAAKNLGVVRSYPFLDEPQKLVEPRNRIIEHMSSTESLKLAHRENVSSWRETQRAQHPLLSQTMWGGAGMCARSFVYEKSYTPHPLRKRFFVNSGFMLPANDALHQLTSFLNDEQLKVSKKAYGTDSLYSLFVNMPAIPIRVIQDASSPSQLIDVALQMRQDFAKLREWLKLFQKALSEDNLQDITNYRRQLDSISEYVNSKIGLGSAQKPVTMEAGLGIFKMVTQANPINTLKNQFGVRATLNSLIFGSNGKQEIKKFIEMFEQRGTAVGYDIEQHFTKNA